MMVNTPGQRVGRQAFNRVVGSRSRLLDVVLALVMRSKTPAGKRALLCIDGRLPLPVRGLLQVEDLLCISVTVEKRLEKWRPGKEQCRGLLSCCRPTVTLTKGKETQKRYWVSWKMVENLTGLNLRAHQ
ncbi:unnamed protein product [Arctogadus glacialis]